MALQGGGGGGGTGGAGGEHAADAAEVLLTRGEEEDAARTLVAEHLGRLAAGARASDCERRRGAAAVAVRCSMPCGRRTAARRWPSP